MARVVAGALAALVLLAVQPAGAAVNRLVTAADPAAALKAATALVAGVGSAVPAAQPTAAALLARMTTPAVQPVALRAIELGTALQPNASSTVMDGDTLDELAAFLASPGNAQALQAAAAANDALADLLDAPPFDRVERCAEAQQPNVPSEIASCYCDTALPWPHCDALLHRWLASTLNALKAELARPRQPAAAAPLANPGRRLSFIFCDGVSGLFTFLASDGACINAHCSVTVPTVGEVYGRVEGCAYAVTANYDPTLPADGQVGEVCSSSECTTMPLAELADVDQSSHIHDAGISGRVGACLSVFGLHELLSLFGFKGAFCDELDGLWRPLQGQVSMSGRVSLGWKIAGLWAEVDSAVQLAEPTDNPLCALSALDARLGCKSWCAWSPGQGVLKATAGWDFLWMGDSQTMDVLSDPVVCRPPPVESPSWGGDDNAAAPSSSGSCTATTQSNVFLELIDAATDRYQPADHWVACCALCYDDPQCYAWSWSPENRRCDGGPCCFFRGKTGYTVGDKPNPGTGVADRVSGVFGDVFPAIGTTV